MKFQLTDEQRALQDAVRSYLRDRFGPAQVRALYDAPESDGVPADLWKAIGEQGWLAVLVPEEHDGIGLGLLDASVIARAFGAGTVPGPWLSTVLLGEALRLAGSDAQKKAHLPGIAAGEVKAAVALLSPGSSPSPAGAPVTAGATLSGRLELVEHAGVADVLLVAATDGSLYLVDPASAGVTVTAHETLDRTSRLSSIVLDGASGERLEGSSPEVLQELLDRAAVLTANDLVGIARKAVMDTVEYDKTRVQFGKPVGSFQAIKHDLADLHIAVTFAEHAATYAAHALDSGRPDARVAVSIAKSKASDTAGDAVGAMIQYHGGIGYTWEHDSHIYFKRAKRLQYAYGDASQHRERIAALLVDGPHPTHDGATGHESAGMASGVA
ncbi:MAG: acyl-CoA dehydrogenase family protein [Mycobacteriales bacterium]|nr:acyl-CoA dehydrogenase family protein [Mycobacteriales bacterium]